MAKIMSIPPGADRADQATIRPRGCVKGVGQACRPGQAVGKHRASVSVIRKEVPHLVGPVWHRKPAATWENLLTGSSPSIIILDFRRDVHPHRAG